MAAPAEPFRNTASHVQDLSSFTARDLEPVLEAEEREWQHTLRWDFRHSANLVRRFLDSRNLFGAVLLEGTSVAGYSYFVFEEGKGLLGDLYLKPESRTANNESLLMNYTMDRIAAMGGVLRVEGQIMILSALLEKPLRHWTVFEVFRREFLSRSASEKAIAGRPFPDRVLIETWSHMYQERAAQLIPASYSGHVDSRINDQYRNVEGARKFLHNILQFPGCGLFHQSASLAAFDRGTGTLCGIVLSSMVAERSGHVTQLCIHPDYRQIGLGRELLRRAILLLEADGCITVSLTVTVENQTARSLYRRLDFKKVRSFGAYVWEP